MARHVAYPDGETVSNTYDPAGMLFAVTGSGAGWTRPYASELRYDVFGNRTHLRFGNGAVSTWSFDPARVRLASATTTLPGSTPSTPGPRVQDLHYSYDLGGNPTGIANTLATRPSNGHLPGDTSAAFTYDGVDRLIRAVGGGSISPSKTTSYDLRFTYTPSHNLAHKELAHLVSNNGGSNAQNPPATNFDAAYVYESGRPHLPSRAGDSALTYDPSGNLLSRETLSTGSVQDYVWDDDGRLVQVTGQGANQRNVYDASGLRVLREGQTGTTVFASPLYDVDGTNQGQKHVFAGATRVATVLKGYTNTATPSASTQPGTPFYFHADHLGSTAAVSRVDGTLNDAHDYFPDGQAWIDSGPKNPINGYLFNGKPIDVDTGFYDFGQRFYDPRMSLWLGVDPAFIEQTHVSAQRPFMLATLAFAGNSPLRMVDPDGAAPDFVGDLAACQASAECSTPWRKGPYHFKPIEVMVDVAQVASNVLPAGRIVAIARLGVNAAIDQVQGQNDGPVDPMPSGPKLDPFGAAPTALTKDNRIGNLGASLAPKRFQSGNLHYEVGGGASPNALTPGERRRIQNAANRIQKPITLVGSRAKGTPGPNSDWDYIIEGSNAVSRGKVRNSLPGAEERLGLTGGRNREILSGPVDRSLPYIKFIPVEPK